MGHILRDTIKKYSLGKEISNIQYSVRMEQKQ